MEPKIIILIIVVILLAFTVAVMLLDKGINLSEKHELELNASYEDGWVIGYEWGYTDGSNFQVIGMGNKLIRDGWATIYTPDNITVWAFTMEGCAAQIEAEGCGIVCAGQGGG